MTISTTREPIKIPVPTTRSLTANAASLAVTLRRMRHAIGLPGGLALAAVLFGQFLGQALDTVVDTPVKITGALTASGLVVLALAARWSWQFSTAAADPEDYGVTATSKLPTRRGLVLLAGLDTADVTGPAAALLKQLPALEYLAIVGTVETEQLGIADAVTDRLLPSAGLDISGSHLRRWEFGNAESVSDAEQGATEAIRWMLGRGLDRSEIVLDVSSGRRPMSYGAKDAADAFSVETQYLAAAWDAVTNRPVPGTHVFKVIRTYD